MQKTISNTTLWKLGSYSRLSREDGDKEESDSIKGQKELIRSFIKSKSDIQLVDEYEDDGYSGVDFERPDFKRLLADIQSGKINCVIVKDLSRLGRNYIETGKLLERFFPFMGVRFIAINDNYDSQSHNGQTDSLIIPFKNLINDAYCADTSRKTRSQLEVKRKKGDFIGAFAAYGYIKSEDNKNRLLIDETVAPVVRDIFRWKIDGMSQKGIADKLNELGIPCPAEHKKSSNCRYVAALQVNHVAKWDAMAIGRILKNELYIGVLTQGVTSTPNYKIKQRVKKSADEWVRVEQSHEPIISIGDFRLVQELLKKDTRIAPGEDSVYLFSGMLYCDKCGQSLVRKIVPSSKSKYVYHVCSTNKKGEDCTSHSISDRALQEAVLQVLQFHIRECARIGTVLEFLDEMPYHQLDAQKLQKQIDDKQAEIDKLTKRKLKLYEDYKDGILNKDEYMSFRDVFAAQHTEAESSLEKLRQEHDNIINNRTESCLWIEHFKKHHDLQCLTRAVVVELIDRITVYENGMIDVAFRYRESYEQAIRFIETLPADEKQAERAVS